VGRTYLKVVVLLLCFFSLALVACSEQPPNKPDRGETHTALRRTVASSGGSVTTSRDAPRRLTIEEAELQSGEEGDQIFVQVAVEGSGFLPRCFLMDGPTRDAARREDVYGRRVESRWSDERSTETLEMGYTYVVVFHEDRGMSGKVPDPRRTPYFVVCSEARRMHTDEAHVEGTPEARIAPVQHLWPSMA
jgi:hypothetical protein